MNRSKHQVKQLKLVVPSRYTHGFENKASTISRSCTVFISKYTADWRTREDQAAIMHAAVMVKLIARRVQPTNFFIKNW